MLNKQQLYFLCQTAISAAYQAGSLIRSYTGKSFARNQKTGMDSIAAQIVTEIDIKAQQIILDVLWKSTTIYDIAILTEETPDDNSRHRKPYFWCIDPIDGTLYFSRHQPGYAVAIALLSRTGIPLISVIYDPCQDKLFYNYADKKTLVNTLPLSWNPNHSRQQTITIILDPDKLDNIHYQHSIRRLKILFENQGYFEFEIKTYGGSVMNAMETLINQPACYFKLPKKNKGGGCVWDFAASNGIFQSIHAVCSDIYGNPLDLNPNDSLYYNHCGVVLASHQWIAESVYLMYKQLND